MLHYIYIILCMHIAKWKVVICNQNILDSLNISKKIFAHFWSNLTWRNSRRTTHLPIRKIRVDEKLRLLTLAHGQYPQMQSWYQPPCSKVDPQRDVTLCLTLHQGAVKRHFLIFKVPLVPQVDYAVLWHLRSVPLLYHLFQSTFPLQIHNYIIW